MNKNKLYYHYKNAKKYIDLQELHTIGATIYDFFYDLNNQDYNDFMSWLYDNYQYLEDDYFYSYSLQKDISNRFVIEFNNEDEDNPNSDLENSYKVLINLITATCGKFKEKWNRLFKALIYTQYDFNKDFTESTSRDLDSTRDLTITEENETSNTTTQKTGFVGFGSTTSQDRTTSDLESDTTENKSKSELGTQDSTTETISKSGLNKFSNQKLLDEEVYIRNKYNFFNIIYDDLDKILCSSYISVSSVKINKIL